MQHKLFDCKNCDYKLKCVLPDKRKQILNTVRQNPHIKKFIKHFYKGHNLFAKGLYMGYYYGEHKYNIAGVFDLISKCIINYLRKEFNRIRKQKVKDYIWEK